MKNKKRSFIGILFALMLILTSGLSVVAGENDGAIVMTKINETSPYEKAALPDPCLSSGADGIFMIRTTMYPAYVQNGDATGAVVYDESVYVTGANPTKQATMGINPTEAQKAKLHDATVAGYTRVGYITKVDFSIEGTENVSNRRLVTEIPANVPVEWRIQNGTYTFTGVTQGLENMDFTYKGYFAHGNGLVNQLFAAYVRFPK